MSGENFDNQMTFVNFSSVIVIAISCTIRGNYLASQVVDLVVTIITKGPYNFVKLTC